MMLAKLVVILCLGAVVGEVILNADNKYRVPGEYHVVLRADLALTDKVQHVSNVVSRIKTLSEKLEVRQQFIFNRLMVIVVHCEDEGVVRKIFSLAEVKEIEVNLKQPGIAQSCTQQDSGSYLWGLSRIASQGLPSYNGATYSYLASDGSDTYAYVVDSGIYIENVDFEGRASRGYTAQALMISEGEQDLNGHGTHCAGTIMGATYGVAKSAYSIAVKIISASGYYTGTDFLDGVNWMYNDFLAKANGNAYKAVASMSLGGSASGTNDAAIQECLDAGLSVVVAAMNNDADACNFSPARVPGCVTVGATDNTDALASFSDWGSCVDILAPGVNIVSTYIGSPTATATMSGTSMATPHVAGAALRYMSQVGYRPAPAEVSSWLTTSGTKGVCDLRGQTSTPNILLYAPCTLAASAVKLAASSEDSREEDDEENPANPSYDGLMEMKQQVELTYYLAIASVVLLTLTLLATVSVCCRTVSQSEAVKSARQQWYLSNMVHNKNQVASKA